MSDFDKEAERERLREKYEQDQEEREVAEKMSELLLQGATMTNAHCSECGDPIFRYDGQEFCATCEKAVDRGDADADDGDIEVTTPDENAQVQFGGDDAAAEGAGNQPPEPEQPPENAPTEQRSQAGTHSGERPARTDRPEQRQQESPGGQSQPARPRHSAPEADADVSSARESLVRTLTRFSQQAEATDDPQRASDHLAAAREAAEALSALQR
jgi:uncharacterized Zn finger protein (UPF0148 family)